MAKAERLPSGNYRVRVYVGSSMVDGKRVRRYETFTGSNKRDVELKAAQFSISLTDIETDIKFGDALAGYLESKEHILSPTTLRGYKSAAKNHFEEIKNKPISKITQTDIQAMINKYALTLSPKTCRNIHGLFSAVIQMYAPNRVFHTTLPKKKKQTIHIPSTDDILIIHKYLKGNKMELPFLLATQLGLRASEIAGLQKSAVNASKNTVTISQALVNGDKGAVIKAPKSYKGYRVLSCNSELCNKILSSPNDPVVGMTSSRISGDWNRAIRKIPVEPFGFHKLRHYFASQAMLQGIPLQYIAEMMGHEGTKMLEQIYLHTFPSEKQRYSVQMANFFSKTL